MPVKGIWGNLKILLFISVTELLTNVDVYIYCSRESPLSLFEAKDPRVAASLVKYSYQWPCLISCHTTIQKKTICCWSSTPYKYPHGSITPYDLQIFL